MSVTVKVLCRLAVFLVAFLNVTLATHREFADSVDAEDGPYSEFTDDLIEYDRVRRSEVTGLQDKKKYDKEQYWNQDDIEVEEEPLYVENEPESLDDAEEADLPPKKIKVRKVRDVRYDEAPRSQYEVYEIVDHAPAESRAPERFVYKGYHYARSPQEAASEQVYARRPEQGTEHFHVFPGSPGSPPAARYTDDGASAESRVSHSSSHGGHNDHQAKHYSSKGGKGDKGYKSSHHNEHGSKGKQGHEKQAKHYDEHGGKKKADFAQGGHHGDHHEQAHGSKGGKFDEKKAHNKGHNTKGYHNKYQKDEYHKEHKFYDDHHKSGHHSRYGDFGSKHSKKEGGAHKKDFHNSGSQEAHSGKKGQYDKGHKSEDHKGHKSAGGFEKHYGHNSDYAKKGGHNGGNSYGYHTKH